jgi:cytochrome c oxidase assembly factor CtaG
MIAAAHPFGWHLHFVWLLALLGFVTWYLRATRRPAYSATARQKLLFLGGAVILAGALTWPLGDLASHWLLVALVLQRLLLTLAVPPLLVLGTPRSIIAHLTRPAAVDAVLRVVVRPLPAVAIVTVVAVSTLTVGAVNLAAQSAIARALIALIVLGSGFVLWAPVLTELPGAQRLSPLGRGGYLIVQSIVPSFLSIVWIFARHSLYPAFTHSGAVVGLTPLLDQQLAGFLAKVSTIAVLWTVAFVIMTRAQAAETAGQDVEPLIWSDVEREIERADRRDRRQGSPGPPPPGPL